MRMIFVNLPVKNVEASKAFFAALGFSHNKQFSDENSASIVIDENIVVMLLNEARFKDFTTLPIADATKATQVLNALSCSSRQEVDDLQGKALAAGAKPWMPSQDHGFMYGTSFQDLDGHVWELMWMDPAAVQPA
ncbi:MAG TPA: VOC family protein [Arsenicitalea sp.]|jgi:predicted lactoylglutathione lyase|nr:VOC family protein [Arsenicitalea sp.]